MLYSSKQLYNNNVIIIMMKNITFTFEDKSVKNKKLDKKCGQTWIFMSAKAKQDSIKVLLKAVGLSFLLYISCIHARMFFSEQRVCKTRLFF